MEPVVHSRSGFHRQVLMVAVVIHVIAAWFSNGYHSADEHFQVIAFAQARMGELPVEHLPWEYDAGIRSSLQPWIAVAVFKAAAVFGVEDPFTRTFLLRLLSALLALVAVHGFVRATLEGVGQAFRRPYILLSYFLWFLPFLHVRFSSEGWSGIFLLFVFTAVLRRSNQQWWAIQAGVFAGIAILCRPPVGLIVLSVVAWMSIVRKDHRRQGLQLLAGAFLVLLLGTLMDTIFYGQFTPSTWNYVRMGFLGDPAHRFDELPWYYYAPWVVKYAIPPIGALLLIAFAVLCVRHPGHLLVWWILPFVLVHTIIPHKELRFLYPLADLAPLVLVLGVSNLLTMLRGRAVRPAFRYALFLLVALNAIGLAVVITSPAGEGRVLLAEQLHGTSPQVGERVGYLIEPTIAWRIGLPAFYLPYGLEEVALDPGNNRSAPVHIDYLVAHPAEAGPFADRNALALSPMASTAPAWEEQLMTWYTWAEGPAPWTLYHATPMDR